MDDNASKGGSYIRRQDGSLQLVERTTAEEATAPKPKTEKKEKADG